MQRLIVRCIILLLLLLIKGRPIDGQTNTNTYHSQEHQITVQYSQSWTELEVDDLGVFIAFLSPIESSSDNFRENVNILSETRVTSTTLDQYYRLAIQQLNTFSDFNLLDSTTVKLQNGRDAISIIYTATVPVSSFRKMNLKFKQIFTMRPENIVYVITYTAQPNKFSTFLDAADLIFNSFAFDDEFATVASYRSWGQIKKIKRSE